MDVSVSYLDGDVSARDRDQRALPFVVAKGSGSLENDGSSIVETLWDVSAGDP